MPDRVGQQMGNYRLVRLLGRGGFAEVYLGEHLRLGTQAAIKVLHTQLADDDVEGFHKEARTIARLEHPHIVRVLDFDVQGGTAFLVMSYAPNGTLRQRHPKGVPLPLETVVSYVKQIVDALQFAHDEKLIHRDIKPENMLLGRRNEILLSDFGIAIVAQSSRYQGTQDMAGTISYMAPEQIQAHPRPASDQYSLGVVVYEWVSGERPFHGSFTEIAIKHSVVPPPSLREKMPTIPADVEQVVMTALAKDPKERFANVQAFANALEQASQKDVPTFVKPLESAIPSPRVTLPPKPLTESPNVVQPAVLAPKVSLETPATPPPAPIMPVVFSKPVGTVLCVYRGHFDVVNAIAWSRDGMRIASGSDDKTVQLWDVATGNQVFTYRGHSDAVRAVAWSPNGKYIASGGNDKTVQVWDAATGNSIVTYRGHSNWGARIRSIVWSPDGRFIASASDDKTVQVWLASTGDKVTTYRGHSKCVRSIAWSPSGRRIASASEDKTVQLWDATTGENFITYLSHSNIVEAVAWSPNGRQIASASEDKTVQIWSASNGGYVFTYSGHSGPVDTVTWLPDGKHIASGSLDKTVQVWDFTIGDKIFIYRGHTAPVLAVAWSPDEKHIASGGSDKTVQVWVVP